MSEKRQTQMKLDSFLSKKRKKESDSVATNVETVNAANSRAIVCELQSQPSTSAYGRLTSPTAPLPVQVCFTYVHFYPVNVDSSLY